METKNREPDRDQGRMVPSSSKGVNQDYIVDKKTQNGKGLHKQVSCVTLAKNFRECDIYHSWKQYNIKS
jgi:hypothetical protein